MARRFEGGKLVVASHNAGKVREIGDLLAPFDVETVSVGELGLPEPEETGTTFQANAELKALAAAHGLTFEQALGLITIDAARLLGLEERVGSLEVGKDGDLALYDGDPFEYTSHCVGVVIEGEVVSEEVR